MIGDGDDHNPYGLLNIETRVNLVGGLKWPRGQTNSIIKPKGECLSLNHYIRAVVIEDLITNSGSRSHVHGAAYKWNIFSGKLVRGICHQKRGL